ncbi:MULTISPECIES: Na+/H+ antiporter NhaC [Natrinema]|uniref:Na+/H+ antiporter NhaC n=1 Tax=Natrinema gari JCM 14663 TaxID=1230459 RepID=L9Z565_9EURY|nr:MULTISPECIES: Na+/H+ antiporter NhaC [Natrinema]AFO57184.1 Na+/H+ antiporter NhaC [Natrinema sp. J7-2]ELY81630.1 Na+/H+ antiporter NhaC [Natrinema gari JCM 14663]
MEYDIQLFEDLDPDARPSLGEALVPVVGMLTFLGIGIGIYGLDPQFPLFWGITFTGLFSYYWLGVSWDTLYDGITQSLLMGLQVVFILFIVYALISTWIHAGTIPAMMYYGLSLLTPAVFLPMTAVITAVITFAIGSSWTAAGTLGVAFIGIGSGLGLPAPMTAGAILTGAYTGDKQSPLSDTTNLAAAVTNTDLYDHINAMRNGTTLAFGISVILFAILGLRASGSIPADRVAEIQTALTGTYTISPLAFVPIVVTFALAIYGISAIPALGTGIFAGAATALVLQDTGFEQIWTAAQSGTSPETGLEVVNDLLASGGMVGGSWAVTIAISALALGGMFESTGIIAVLAHHLGRLSRSVASLTGVTVFSSISMNILAAEQYVSIVVPGITLRNLYEEKDLKSENLSRAIESSGTVTSALVPWNSGAVFMAGTLGVSTFEYAPYYFLGFLSPLILILMGITGWNITHKETAETESATAEHAEPVTAERE